MRQLRWSKNFVCFATRCLPGMGTAKLTANAATSTSHSCITKLRYRLPAYNKKNCMSGVNSPHQPQACSYKILVLPGYGRADGPLSPPSVTDHSPPDLNPSGIPNTFPGALRGRAFFFAVVRKAFSHGFLSQTELRKGDLRSNVLERHFYWCSAG